MSDQEINPYALYPEVQMDRRPRYYDGQFLGSADFIDAQRYDIDRRRRHLRATVRPGVVAGLDVTGAVDGVTIAAGAAVDDLGRQVVLVADEEKGVREADRGKNLTLYMLYGETTSDQAHAEQGTAGFTRFLEMPVIDYVEAGGPLPEHAVVLAALQVDGGGNVVADGAARPRAGVLIPGATPLTITSDDSDPGRATLAAALRVDVPQGTASDATNPALRVGGDATVTGSLRVNQTSSTGYGGVDVSVSGLTVDGPIAVSANSAVRGLGIGYAPPALEGALTARRASVGVSSLAAGEALHVAGVVGITGDTTIGGDATIAGALDVTRAATLRASLGVSGSASVGIDHSVGRDLSVTRNATISGTADVTGATRLGASLTVAGATTVGGVTTVNNRIAVTGEADIGGLLTVGGTATIGGNTGITGTLSATGAATIGGAATISGGVSVGGGLTVGANITVRGDMLDLGGGQAGRDAAAGKIRYQGWSDGLDIVGAGTTNTNRKIKLFAEGGTTLTGGLSASGAIDSGGAISASGAGTFGGALTVGGGATVDNNAVFKKGVVIGQTETTGYGNVAQDGNDLVVNGQFAAGGSGGAAMYSLAVGYDAQGGKEGYVFVSERVGIGTASPGQRLEVAGNTKITGWAEVQGHLLVSGGTDNNDHDNGLWFKRGNDDYAGLSYWYTDDGGRLQLSNGNDANDAIIMRQQQSDVITIRNRKVGIGGDVGTSTLRLHGSIEHDYGCYNAMSHGNRVMICLAVINSSQSFIARQGISSITRHNEGWYQIFYEQSFSDQPAVVVTQWGSGDTRDNCLVDNITTTSVYVKTGNNDGNRRDRAFTLIAIGRR